MKTGALIITTGLPGVSGINALTAQVGAISAGQRIIAAFQRCGVSVTGLVVGPEDKKAERAFAQAGVVFLRCAGDASFDDGVREGLRFLLGKLDRVFLVPGDMPLFLPQTLESLLGNDVPAAIPVYSQMHGWPVLLRADAISAFLESEATLEDFLARESLERIYTPVPDTGVVIRSGDMTHRSTLIRTHDRQLIRPSVGISLTNGSALYDDRLSMLLHLVDDTRSVLDACSLMQISYSAAWKMLNHAEEELGYPLVRRIRGGPEGSGTELTEKGRLLMTAYDRLQEQLTLTAKELYDSIFLP